MHLLYRAVPYALSLRGWRIRQLLWTPNAAAFIKYYNNWRLKRAEIPYQAGL